MKRIGICFLLITGSLIIHAQPATHPDSLAKRNKADSTTVEVESSFPGGAKGWNQFLSRTLVYPRKAVRKKIQGEVIAQFIVEKDGSLSDIKILSGPEELWDAVLDVLKQSPNWRPAVQNGKKVKSYKKQPFIFSLTTG